jgi:hypothetical protein
LALTQPGADNEPIVITFGLTIDNLSKYRQLDDAPRDYPSLCDWLEQDLRKKLSLAFDCKMSFPEPSERNGETLSVRVVFVRPDLENLRTFEESWWEIIEIAFFSEIYGRD